MYIESVPNRNSPPAILLRESFRANGKVVKRTIANLSELPTNVIEGLRTLLLGGTAVGSISDAFVIERSLPHGHVAAVLGTLRHCGLDVFFDKAPVRLRTLLVALVVARIIEPSSKLATHRSLCPETATHSLAHSLNLNDVDVNDLYEALDWLLEAQPGIERKLARKHLGSGSLVLYDLTSTWMTGRHCPLAAYGYSRDDRRHDAQIVFGLVCDDKGCPLAVEVFPGNTSDAQTVASQVTKLKNRYGIDKLAWVGDRGMLTQSRIETVLKPLGLDWISSLRATQINALAREQGPFQPSLFDERNLVEITSPDYPGERLILCRNPLLAQERAIKREALLQATEAELDKIVVATKRQRRPLRGKDEIALRTGRIINKFRMAKHFQLTLLGDSFSYSRNTESITREASQDGLYVIRTSLDAARLSSSATVAAYKNLSSVERAFRSLKTVDLHIRPIFHWNANRVRSHVFLCMLAYYVEWHLRNQLKHFLFNDEEIDQTRARQLSAVIKAKRSPTAKKKDSTHKNESGDLLHSLRTLLNDLATLTCNICHSPINPNAKFVMNTQPTPLQEKIFRTLGVNPTRTQ